MKSNPYSWNTVNPDLCFGRDALLADLLSGLPGSTRYSFGIAGGRRMGKTTILRRVELELQAGIEQWRSRGLLVVPVYVDGLALGHHPKPSDLWSHIFRALTDATPEFDTNGNEATNFQDFKQLAESVITSLSLQLRLVVMFDEIEPITVSDWGDSFFDHWRALLSNSPGLSEFFTAVFAGARDMDALRRDLTSPLRDVLEWRNLRALEYEDACQLMQEPIEVEWPRSFLDTAYEETGGHPMLLQYVMQHVVDHVTSVSPELCLQQAVHKFARERGWQFSDWWERFCMPASQRIYARLPDDGSLLPLRSITREFRLGEATRALEVLLHVGIAASDEEGFAYRYNGKMFRDWYRTFGMLSDSPSHDPHLYAQLQKVSSALANKYLSAWQIYASDIPNYSGVLVELRGVLEYLVEQFAPSELVRTETGFKLENGHDVPTLRQRIRYLARRIYSNTDRAKEIVSDYNLLEIACEQLAQLATMAHRTASGMAHETASRDMAYRALKQWDSIIAQLVPPLE